MNWYYECHHVKCPYYVDHSYPRRGSSPKITCYPEAGTEAYLQLRFKDITKRSDYMRAHCFTDFEKCTIYQILEKKGANENVADQGTKERKQ